MIPKDLTLLEDWELDGEWWIAGRSRQKLPGTLAFRAGEGLRLKISGNFADDHPFSALAMLVPEARNKRMKTILGAAPDGTRVTLLRCFGLKYGQTTEYLANIGLVGAHYRAAGAIRVNAINIEYTGLEAWTGAQPFSHEATNAGEAQSTSSIKYTAPPPIRISIPKHRLQIHVGFESDTIFERSTAALAYRAVLRVIPGRPMKFGTLQRRHGDVDHLMMLLSGMPVRTRRLTADLTSDDSDELAGAGLAVFFNQIGKGEVPRPFTNELLFPATALGADLEQFVRNYFDTVRRFRGIYNVLFGNLRSQPAYLETRFFHLAQCLEAFHRLAIRGTGKHVTPDRWRELRQLIEASLPGGLPENVRGAVVRKIAEANKFSFQDGLKQLFASVEPKTSALVTTDIPRFIKAIVHTRNWFTHLERQRKSKPFPQEIWHIACNRIEMLLLILILKRCGLAEDRIRERLGESRRYSGAPLSLGPE